jgi:hypothetical protein
VHDWVLIELQIIHGRDPGIRVLVQYLHVLHLLRLYLQRSRSLQSIPRGSDLEHVFVCPRICIRTSNLGSILRIARYRISWWTQRDMLTA